MNKRSRKFQKVRLKDLEKELASYVGLDINLYDILFDISRIPSTYGDLTIKGLPSDDDKEWTEIVEIPLGEMGPFFEKTLGSKGKKLRGIDVFCPYDIIFKLEWVRTDPWWKRFFMFWR